MAATVVTEVRRRPPLWIRILTRLAINLFGLWLIDALDLIATDGEFGTLLLAALVLGIVNLLLRPIVLLLSLPFIILTLGFFLVVVNMFMLSVTSGIVDNFETLGFWRTLFAALLMMLVNMALSGMLRDLTTRREVREVDYL
ncbi:MAG TPA: phage holin family protein [Solirubrobacterales bacterium]|nr:phage holin family protein [Solirubrobacterales bacterium]